MNPALPQGDRLMSPRTAIDPFDSRFTARFRRLRAHTRFVSKVLLRRADRFRNGALGAQFLHIEPVIPRRDIHLERHR
jgi:hypothetical protein